MKSKRRLSIVISPPSGQSSIRIGISVGMLKLLAGVIGGVLVLGLFGLGMAGTVFRKANAYRDVFNENARLRRQNKMLTETEKEVDALKKAERSTMASLSGAMPGGWDEAIQAIGGDSAFDAMLQIQIAAESETSMVWPHDGPVTRSFEPGQHDGIDIAGQRGAPIRASWAGRVTFSGWDNLLGHLVIINHGNGISTAYGHNDTVEVRTGDMVKKGQTIARLGSTGESSGPHVHFEVRRGTGFLPPLDYLKPRD